MQIRNQKIHIGNIPVSKLAKKYGTPIFVYDEQKIRHNFKKVLNTFQKHYNNFRLFYAIKSNNNPAIAKIMISEGAGIDAASVNEIKLAKKLEVKKENIIFSGNFLSDDDLQEGLKSNVIFNLDDDSLLPRLLKFGKPKIISFRINPGIGKSNVGHYVETAGPQAKFGISLKKALKGYEAAKKAGIKRFGVHMMTGSCITDADYFGKVTERLMDIIGEVSQKLNINFEFIDIGGGLGIPYGLKEKPLDLNKAAKLIADAVKNKCKEYNLETPTLIMEPGRYFVANAGYLIGKIHGKKEDYKTIYGSDLGMNLVPRIILYDAFHEILIDGKTDSRKSKINLCGQICEQTDLWGKELNLPNPDVGDIIVIKNCGSYCFGMSYQYNGRLLPAEILVNGENSHIIREVETLKDMIYNTHIPKHLS